MGKCASDQQKGMSHVHRPKRRGRREVPPLQGRQDAVEKSFGGGAAGSTFSPHCVLVAWPSWHAGDKPPMLAVATSHRILTIAHGVDSQYCSHSCRGRKRGSETLSYAPKVTLQINGDTGVGSQCIGPRCPRCRDTWLWEHFHYLAVHVREWRPEGPIQLEAPGEKGWRHDPEWPPGSRKKEVQRTGGGSGSPA